jgi:anti-anti-sigma regulatory factor
MPIKLQRRDESNEVCLEGAVDIAGAADLKALLLEGLAAGKPLHISVEKLTSVDVTAVQLLSAATREAKAAGLKMTLDGPTPEPVMAALRSAGFFEFPVAVGIGQVGEL